jgi:hypothetical protein
MLPGMNVPRTGIPLVPDPAAVRARRPSHIKPSRSSTTSAPRLRAPLILRGAVPLGSVSTVGDFIGSLGAVSAGAHLVEAVPHVSLDGIASGADNASS